MTTITTAHNNKTLNRATLHRINNFISKCHHLSMGKATNDSTSFNFHWSRTCFSLLNNCWEVLASTFSTLSYVWHTRPACHTCGVNTIFIRIFYRGDAVGGHQNGAVKWGKLFPLLPPCITVVTYEVVILFKCRIVMSREHLTVSININACTRSLLEKFFHIF